VHEAEGRLEEEREGRRDDGLPEVPPAAPAPGAGLGSAEAAATPAAAPVGGRAAGATASASGSAVAAAIAHDYWLAREALSAAGLELVGARRALGDDEVVAAAADLGYPVALKALGLLHKSDLGGVALGIGGAGELRATVRDMHARLAPPEYAVERMAPVADGVELLVGCRWDPHFGPVLLVGLGGLYAELLQDVRLALAPVSEAGAAELLGQLRGAPLLAGARGRPPLAAAAAAAAAAALSCFAAAHPEFAELEANPLLVTTDAAVALDARLVRARPAGSAGDHDPGGGIDDG
ncbi:MAG: acetate--CoA ligase family protein, partial [Thermoleophilia bacterium]|nr:acetate--CoA ligase family protein [Thermoleophilia bacterium]